MATLRANLTTIRTAIYGKQVRKAIADALEQAVDSRYVDIEDFFDAALSSTSNNAVQNHVINEALNALGSRVTDLETSFDPGRITALESQVFTYPHVNGDVISGSDMDQQGQSAHLLGISKSFVFDPSKAETTDYVTVRFKAHGRYLMICTNSSGTANGVGMYILAIAANLTDVNMYCVGGNDKLFDFDGVPASVSQVGSNYVDVDFVWGDRRNKTRAYFIPLATSTSFGS